MIEDDLRELIGSRVPGIAVYSRIIPLAMPECIVVLSDGGMPTSASIRRAIHRVTIMGVSTDQPTASSLVRTARDALIEGCPWSSATTHYYTATAVAGSPSLRRKAYNGPRYIEAVDMEVVASLQ